MIVRCIGYSRALSNDVEHAILESFFVLTQPVLLPGVVKDTPVKLMTLHAVLEEAHARSVVGLLLELERAAVLHKLSELRRVSTAQFFE